MIIVSYDIEDDKVRRHFAKMLTENGAVRLQYSVYEVVNTQRIIDNIKSKIEVFSKQFTMDDSVVIFSVSDKSVIKYGNSIHRDQGLVFL